MKIQTFIFCHDQETILDYIKSNKFKYLPNVKYIFLGNKDCGKLLSLSNVVIARNLPVNREEFPKLLSYTGWFSIMKNNLIDSDTNYINLFEYDVNTSINFDEVFFRELRKSPDGIIYNFGTVNSEYFLQEKYYEKLKSILNSNKIDIDQFYKLNDELNWTKSTNVTFNRNSFYEFMNWFDEFFIDISTCSFPGHEFERSLSFFIHLKNKNFLFLKGLLEHLMVNSHSMTTDMLSFNYKLVKNKLIK